MSDDPDSPSPPPTPETFRTRAEPGEAGPLERLRERLVSAFGGNGHLSFRQGLETRLKNGEAEDAFTPSERFMLLNILRFSDKRVDDVMVPRVDIVAIDETAPLSEVLSTFEAAGHSRLPVFHETLDDPRGMVHIKDLLAWIAKCARKRRARPARKRGEAEPEPAAPSGALSLAPVDLSRTLASAQITRAVLYVPPSMQAVDLLLKMQSTRVHMAVVIDEYGGTDGLVSIEDLVEEIVGDIEDEHDVHEGPLIQRESPTSLIADARAEIDELEAILGFDLLPEEREEDVDTLGGLLFSLVGRIPARGEVIKHGSGLEFEVLDGDPRRVKRLRILTPGPLGEGTAAGGATPA